MAPTNGSLPTARFPKKRQVFSRRSIQLAERIGVDPADRETLWDIWCGEHSGMPECCITFYVKVWQPLAFARWDHEFRDEITDEVIDVTNAELVDLADDVQMSYFEMLERLGPYQGAWRRLVSPGYIVCPACALAGNIVRVNRCHCRSELLGSSQPHRRQVTQVAPS